MSVFNLLLIVSGELPRPLLPPDSVQRRHRHVHHHQSSGTPTQWNKPRRVTPTTVIFDIRREFYLTRFFQRQTFCFIAVVLSGFALRTWLGCALTSSPEFQRGLFGGGGGGDYWLSLFISDSLSGCEGLVERDGQHLHRPRHHAGSRGHRQRVHATATVTSRRLTALVGLAVAPCGSLVALCVCACRELPHRWTWKQVAGHLALKGSVCRLWLISN